MESWKTNKTFPSAHNTRTEPYGYIKNTNIALHTSLPDNRHEPSTLKYCWRALQQFSCGSRINPLQAIAEDTFITEMDIDNMDSAPLAGWMFEGDTQPFDSQLYRDYNNKVSDMNKEPCDTKLATDTAEILENGSMVLRKEVQVIRDQKSPTPPGWLNHKGGQEIDDELSGAPNLPVIPSLKHQLYPTTPGTIGKKRNFRGDIITPATDTPGSALTAQFNANILKSIGAGNHAVSLSQMFAGTQAQSSPVPNDLKSDPIFQRPSPNIEQGTSDFPAEIQSSPTKAIHSISPDALDAVIGAYTTMKESQLRREQRESSDDDLHPNRQSKLALSDFAEAQEDSLHKIVTMAEERMLRDRRLAQKRQDALITCKNLHAPKRPQTIRKARKPELIGNTSGLPMQNQHDTLHRIPVSHDDSSSLSDADSTRELCENNVEYLEVADQQQVLALHNKSSGELKSNQVFVQEQMTSKLTAGEVQNLSQSSSVQNIAEQTTSPRPSGDEEDVHGSGRGDWDPKSIRDFDRLPKTDPTILIPQSQPAVREVGNNRARREDNVENISPKKMKASLRKDRSTMSSSPPMLQNLGQSEKHINCQQLQDNIIPKLGTETHINGDTPYQAFTPRRLNISFNNLDESTPTTAKQQIGPQHEEQIEVPETDPPEYMSSHRSIRPLSKATDSNNIINSPLQTLPHTTESLSQATRDRERHTGSTHYETARSKFSVVSHPTSRTQRGKMPQTFCSDQIPPSKGRRKSSNKLSDLKLNSIANDSSNSNQIASHSSPIPAGRRRSGRNIEKHDVSSTFSLGNTKATSSFDAAFSADENPENNSKPAMVAKAHSFPKLKSQSNKSTQPADSKGPHVNPASVQQKILSEAVEPFSNAKSSINKIKEGNSAEELVHTSNANRATEASYSKWIPKSAYAPRRVLALFKDRSHYYWPATSCGRVSWNSPVYRIRFDDGAVDDIEAKHVCIFNLVPGDSVKVDIPTLKKNIYVIREFERARTSSSPKEHDENVPTDIHGHEMVKVAVKGRHSSTDHCTSVPLSSIYLTGTMWPHYKDRLLSMDISEGHDQAFRCVTPKDDLSVPGSPSSRTRRITHYTPSKRDKPIVCSEHGEKASHLFAGMAFVISSSEEEVKRSSLISTLSKNGATVLDEDFDSLFSLNDSQRHSFSSLYTSESSEVKDLKDLVLSSEAEKYGFTALLAHEFSRRVKHMQALALGLPVLHSHWVKDCIQAQSIVPWKHYVLPAGKSSLLDGAIVSRAISTYDANTAKLKNTLAKRDLILPGERVVMVEPSGSKRNEPSKARGKREGDGNRQRKYAFLACAMGASAICRVKDLVEAKKVLQKEKGWTQVHVDRNIDGARRILLSKNHREMNTVNRDDTSLAEVVIADHEEVIQNLILGKSMNKVQSTHN